MHICDKCKKFNKCYSESGKTPADLSKREKVESSGCRDYRELTLKEMFFGGRRHGKNE